jgi:3-oxoacyl-[acyl-carrier-protein] synthase II
MPRRVVVTGIGAISPVGKDVGSTWSAVVEGRTGVDIIKRFDADAEGLKTRIAAEVKEFEPADYFDRKTSRRIDRVVQFALIAADEAVADAQLAALDFDPYRAGVMVGSGIGGIGTLLSQAKVLAERGPSRISPFFIPMILIDMATGEIAIQHGLKGPNMATISACATGAHSIGEAAEVIRRGAADLMVCGGSEAGIEPLSIAGFNVMGALSTRNDEPHTASRPFDATRDGFVMGEGAGVLVLEELEHARRRGTHIYGEVYGYGATADAHHITAPAPDGEGAATAMSLALDQFDLTPQDITYINAHGTGTSLNDAIETTAIRKVFGEQADRLLVSSTKAVTGHLLGAAGALEAIICLKALETQTVPPTINYLHPDPECDLDYVPNASRQASVDAVMSNSLGFGGHNASLILRRLPETS